MSVEDLIKHASKNTDSEIRYFQARTNGYVEPGSDEYRRIIRSAATERGANCLSDYELNKAITQGYNAVVPISRQNDVGLEMVRDNIKENLRPYFGFNEKLGMRGYNLVAYAYNHKIITSLPEPTMVRMAGVESRAGMQQTTNNVLKALGGK